MKIIICALFAFAGVVMTPNLANAQSKDDMKSKELKVGDQAPDWKLKGSDGKTYQLSKYKGKQAVVVSWYPMALTGG